MKTNKWGIVISFFITTISLFGAIFLENWWQNFSFAIFGSAILSFTICIINYITILKKSIDEIVISIYRFENSGYSNLYSTECNISLNELQRLLDLMEEYLYKAYIQVYEFRTGLFFFHKKRKVELFGLEYKIECSIDKIFKIGMYIEKFFEDANKNTKKIYKYLDKFLDEHQIYENSLEICKMFKSKIHSSQTRKDKEEYNLNKAKEFKNEIFKFEIDK